MYVLVLLDLKEILYLVFEVVIIIEEEMIMGGVFVIDLNYFEGKIFINIDFEEDYKLFVSSVGGVKVVEIIFVIWDEMLVNMDVYCLYVGGLKGGYFGMEIDK